MALTKEEVTINEVQRILIRLASNELDSRKLDAGRCEPELVGDDMDDAKIDYPDMPLEVRVNEIRKRGLVILSQEWDNEEGLR
jgi:hypothetical protein